MKTSIKPFSIKDEYFFTEGCFIVELSNSSDDPDVSIARARVEAGHTTKWHSLAEITERYVILEGLGRVEVGNSAPENVGVGDVVIIPPQVRQRITNIGENDLIFLAICTPPFTLNAYKEL